MSRRTSEADKAIRVAWENERQLVIEGKGTRNWTPEQQQDIREKGKAYDDDRKAFQGHHMMSVKAYPEYQGEAENIQFLTRAEHILAHNGYTGNATNGYYDPVTGETTNFNENKYEPCKIIKLSDPIKIQSTEDVNNPSLPSSQRSAAEKRSSLSRPRRPRPADEDGNPVSRSHRPLSVNEDGQPKPRLLRPEVADKEYLPPRPHSDELTRKPAKKGFISEVKHFFDNVANFFGYETKADWGRALLNGSIEVLSNVAQEVSKSLIDEAFDNSRKKKESSVTSYSSVYDEEDDNALFNTSAVNDVDALKPSIEISEQKPNRSLTDEHTVSPHRQRYYINGVKTWKEKESYPRGKKTEE